MGLHFPLGERELMEDLYSCVGSQGVQISCDTKLMVLRSGSLKKITHEL